jgi:hypothetical protein
MTHLFATYYHRRSRARWNRRRPTGPWNDTTLDKIQILYTLDLMDQGSH